MLTRVTLNHRQVALRVSSGMNGFVIRTEDVLDLLLYLEARVLRSPPSYPWVVESFPCALVYFIRDTPYKIKGGGGDKNVVFRPKEPEFPDFIFLG